MAFNSFAGAGLENMLFHPREWVKKKKKSKYILVLNLV